MGPIGTVRRSFLSAGYSRGKVEMQLKNIKRVGNDKESLTGLLTVKHGSNQVTESATVKWSSSDEGFKVVSSGVSTIIDGDNSISVEFDMSDLGLEKTLNLKLDESVNLSSSTTASTDTTDRTVTALSNYNDLTTVLSDVKTLASNLTTVTSDVDVIKTEQIDDREVVTNLSSNLTTAMSDVEAIKTELEFPQLDYVLDASMSDIPDDGELDKLLIFRKYPLDLQDMTLTKKPNTLGGIMVIGRDIPENKVTNRRFIDLAAVYGDGVELNGKTYVEYESSKSIGQFIDEAYDIMESNESIQAFVTVFEDNSQTKLSYIVWKGSLTNAYDKTELTTTGQRIHFVENQALIEENVGRASQQYISSQFADFASVTGLEAIDAPQEVVVHTMKNVVLQGLGDNEKDINALTLVTLGGDEGHVFENIKVIDSLDDGIEIFGGSVNMSDIMIDSATDDYFDTDQGHTGTITNLSLYQTAKWLGKSLIECGNSGDPTTTTFENVTFNDGTDVSSYQNNGSDMNFNINSGSEVTINGFVLTEPQDEFPGALVIESGLLSGDWTISGRIFRVNNDGENEIFPNYSTTINITQNSSYPEFLVVESGVSDDEARTAQGVTVGLLELDKDDMILTLTDYDDNGIFTFTGIEKDAAGNIIKFSSGKYIESGFTNESTDTINQMPTVGVVTLEKV